MSKVFDQKLLIITEQQDLEIAGFIPDSHVRDAQYHAFHNSVRSSIREPVTDAVEGMRAWIKSEKAVQLRDYLRSQGWPA